MFVLTFVLSLANGQGSAETLLRVGDKTKVMKYILTFALFLSSVHLMAQSEKFASDLPQNEPQCPPGLCPVVSFNLEVFNFHKPRTSCNNGFGLCIRFSTSVTCEFCRWKTGVNNDVVYSTIIVSHNTAEWHLPLSLKNEKIFEGTDMSTFEVEDQTFSIEMENGHKYFVKGGQYPVEIDGEEMIVHLKLE